MLVLCVATAFAVEHGASPYRQVQVASVPKAPVAIVFGAGLTPKGHPSAILADRVDAAIALYRAGKVDQLLMSGDNRFVWYNEPRAMKDYAVKHGVPEGAILLDFGGRNTYDTCYRARHVFGVQRAVLVSQNYHIARATFLARGLGIDAVGFGVPDFDKYPQLRWSLQTREYLADIGAALDLYCLHRQPEVGG